LPETIEDPVAIRKLVALLDVPPPLKPPKPSRRRS
jgi:hypothetical protein